AAQRALTGIADLVTLPELQSSLAALHRSLDQIGTLTEQVTAQVGPVTGDLRASANQLNATLQNAQQIFESGQGVVGPDAPMRRDLAALFRQLQQSARSIQELADYLSRHPDALIRGRTAP